MFSAKYVALETIGEGSAAPNPAPDPNENVTSFGEVREIVGVACRLMQVRRLIVLLSVKVTVPSPIMLCNAIGLFPACASNGFW